MKTINSDGVDILSWVGDLEEGALNQAMNMSKLPFAFNHIALMPDAHFGHGVPIGSIIATRDVIIPNAIGVDIGCGVISSKSNLKNNLDKKIIRQITSEIKESIPTGEGKANKIPQQWNVFEGYIKQFNKIFSLNEIPGWYTDHIWELAYHNLRSLGGGNHFIELQTDEENFIYIMIHSGSRNLGYRIADYYNEQAKEKNELWYSNVSTNDLSFLPVNHKLGKDYIRDMFFACEYARENRKRMMLKCQEIIKDIIKDIEFKEAIDIHHNYADRENHFGQNVWVHRKGAIRVREGEIGFIPGSMGTPSYIVKGLGNIHSFQSSSHGAGRKMSRTKAVNELSIEECDQMMDGIIYDRWNKIRRGKNKGKFDTSEAPGAYKDIDLVMEQQKDLVEIITKLKPIGVVKG